MGAHRRQGERPPAELPESDGTPSGDLAEQAPLTRGGHQSSRTSKSSPCARMMTRVADLHKSRSPEHAADVGWSLSHLCLVVPRPCIWQLSPANESSQSPTHFV